MITVVDAGVAFVKRDEENFGRNPVFITLSNNSSNTFIKKPRRGRLGRRGEPGVALPVLRRDADHQGILGTSSRAGRTSRPPTPRWEGFIAAKVLVEGLRRAGPKLDALRS